MEMAFFKMKKCIREMKDELFFSEDDEGEFLKKEEPSQVKQEPADNNTSYNNMKMESLGELFIEDIQDNNEVNYSFV